MALILTRQGVPTLDGLPIYKPPYSRVTAYDLSTGTIAWQVPLGDGPRDHPLLKDLKLGPLGDGVRASPLVTATLLFVSEYSGFTRGEPMKVGGRDLSNYEPPPSKVRAFDKKTGQLLWEQSLPVTPAASPMTYSYGGTQYLVVAIGGGLQAELIAYALPKP